MLKKASVNDILVRLQQVTSQNEVNLTFSNKMVYVKIVDFAMENAVQDFPVWMRCQVSINDLAEYCDVAPRIVHDTLRKLDQCGVIRYVIKRPKPSIITLYKKYCMAESEE